MSETKAKRDDKQSDLDDLHTKIDKATSRGCISIRVRVVSDAAWALPILGRILSRRLSSEQDARMLPCCTP